jgi:hypothetical protein
MIHIIKGFMLGKEWTNGGVLAVRNYAIAKQDQIISLWNPIII